MSNFIREVQLFIGPLDEVQGGGSRTQAIVIKSSGKQNEQRLGFTVQKNTMGSVNSSQIVIYNLSQKTRQIIAKSGTNIILQAGYKQGNLTLQTIAKGSVSNTISERQGGDIITTINALDGAQGTAIGRFSNSYKGQIELSKIVEDVARKIPGVQVSKNEIKLTDKMGKKGATFTGRCTHILDRLSRHWGFSWSIQNGVFKALPDESTSGNLFEISTKLGNLIHTTPRIDNVLQVVTGVEINSVLDPRIQPYDQVKLTSSVSPSLDGTYQITNLTHSGDTHGNQWVTNLQCLYNLGQIQANIANG